MKNIFFILFCCCSYGFSFGQTHKKQNGNLFFGLDGGLRNNQSNHFTPYLGLDGLGTWGANDRVYFSPVWNLQGCAAYEIPKIPFRFGLQAGIQWNRNVNFGGTHWWFNSFRPIKTGFRTINMGVSVEYFFYRKKQHHIGSLLNLNVLYIPFNTVDFTYDKISTSGKIISRNGNDTLPYIFNINSNHSRYGMNFQLETGFVYEYQLTPRWYVGAKLYYQIGFYQMLSTSAVFGVTDVPGYNGNTSFSTNKGDGLCLNVRVGYKIPFYGKSGKRE